MGINSVVVTVLNDLGEMSRMHNNIANRDAQQANIITSMPIIDVPVAPMFA